MPDFRNLHDIDEDRWVLTTRVSGRCYLGGNAHTHPGHMHAWSEQLDKLITIRKDDITEASPVAWAWIAGFLTGNEPDFAHWLGTTWDEAEPHETQDDPLFWQWKDDLRFFRAHGHGGLRDPGECDDEDADD